MIMNDLLKKDLEYLWHPYTQAKDAEIFPPIFIEKAKGLKLFGADGKVYCDTISSWWCNVHGHCHPDIVAAIKKQVSELDHVLFAGFTHQPAIDLAAGLIDIAPKNLRKVFFSDNGSTAVEVALKMSFQHWRNLENTKKNKFVCLDYGYHGDTIGAMSVSGESLFNQQFKDMFFKAYKIPSPYCYRCPVSKEAKACSAECLDALEELLDKSHQNISGFILEPLVMAAGGMIIYPPKYLRKARQLTKKYNVHLILDEVATGFGRTGKMFACQHADVEPDFLCLSKGITSGTLPLAATLTTRGIFDSFYADYSRKKTFYHGHTYTANPVACAAALESLSIFNREKTLDRMNKLIPLFNKHMESFRGLPFVGDVRYIGLIGAIELVKNKKTKQPFDFAKRIGMKIYQQGLKQGLILRPLGDVVYFYLPLSVTKFQLNKIFGKANRVFSRLKF